MNVRGPRGPQAGGLQTNMYGGPHGTGKIAAILDVPPRPMHAKQAVLVWRRLDAYSSAMANERLARKCIGFMSLEGATRSFKEVNKYIDLFVDEAEGIIARRRTATADRAERQRAYQIPPKRQRS